MTDLPATDDQTIRSRISWTGVGWGLFLMVLFAAASYKARENQHDTDVRTAWQHRMAQLQDESKGEYDRLKAYLRSDRPTPLTQSELETELNDGQPFHHRPGDEKVDVQWLHPKYGISLRLTFQSGELRGWSMSSGSPTLLPENHEIQPRRFHSRAESIRQTLRKVAVGSWIVAALAACVFRRHAWTATQIMLASALTYGAATVVSPAYSLTVQGIFSNDPMFWAVVMWLGALAMVARNWPRRDMPHRFRIRDVLLGIAFIAVLLTMGPLGYFGLAVFVVSGFLGLAFLAFRTIGEPGSC